MARHRDVRAMNIDEEYEGYYDSAYGHSVEEEFCISPRTEAEFLYNRDAQKHSMSAFLGASPDSQLEECSGNEDSPRIRCDSVNESQNLSSIDRAKLQSCVEAMQNVVGDTVSENILIKAATDNGFDVEKALDAVLSGSAFETPKPPRSRKVVGTGKEFCIHRKYPTPDCKYWASKNSHHCRYNIKAIGYSSYLPIYDSLSLDLLKILIAFIESCPSSESQYCCKMCQKNDFASHLKTFYDSVVLFSTNFGSSELFVHRYRKMWNDLYLLIMDFQIEFETQERLRDGHVFNKTLSEKAFLCISKLLGFFSELLSESISLVSSKPSSFPCDEQLHLTKLLQIIQFHYPLTVLRSYTFTPSTASTSQLLCKDHSIQVLALPTKKVFKKQKYYPSVICEKLKSFSISFQFIASCFQLKSCQSLHTDQHYFVSRLTVPEGDCKHKVMKCVMPKGQNIFYSENMYLETYVRFFCCLLLCLVKFNIFRSKINVSALWTAMFRLWFNLEKCENCSNYKCQQSRFRTSVKTCKNKCHEVMKILNFIHSYFSVSENESIGINFFSSHSVTYFSDCRNIELLQLRQDHKKQLVAAHSPAGNLSEIMIMDFFSKIFSYLLQKFIKISITSPNNFECKEIPSCYKRGSFSSFQLQMPNKNFSSEFNSITTSIALQIDVKGVYSKIPELRTIFPKSLGILDLSGMNSILFENTAITFAKATFVCTDVLHLIVKKYNYQSTPHPNCISLNEQDAGEESNGNKIILSAINLHSGIDALEKKKTQICFANSGCSIAPMANTTCDPDVSVTTNLTLNCHCEDAVNASDHPSRIVKSAAMNMETGTNATIPSLANLGLLSSPIPMSSNCGLSMDGHMEPECMEVLTTGSNELLENAVGSCALLDLYSSADLGKLSTATTQSAESCSDIESCDDLSLDDLFLSLDLGAKETLLSDENSVIPFVSTKHTNMGCDRVINSTCDHADSDQNLQAENDFSLVDLSLCTESFVTENVDHTFCESEPQKLLSDSFFLTDSFITEVFTPVATPVHQSLNILYADETLNSVCPAVSDCSSRTESAQEEIQTSVLCEQCFVEHCEESKDPPCILQNNLKYFDLGVEEKCSSHAKQHQQSNILYSGQKFYLPSEVTENQCHALEDKPQFSKHSSFSELYSDNQCSIVSEQNKTNCNLSLEVCCDGGKNCSEDTTENELKDPCGSQRNLLNLSLSDIYLSGTNEAARNSDFPSTHSELPVLSLAGHDDPERLNVSMKCCLGGVQKKMPTVSPENRCYNNESINFSVPNSDMDFLQSDVPSDLCSYKNGCEMFKNSEEKTSCCLSSDATYSDIFGRPENCGDHRIENKPHDLPLSNFLHNKIHEVPESLNSGTAQNAFSDILLSDICLGDKWTVPKDTGIDAAHNLSSIPASSLYDGRSRVHENSCIRENCSLCIPEADLGKLVADEPVALNHIPVASLSDLCFKMQSEPEHQSLCGNDESSRNSLLDCYTIFKPADEAKTVESSLKNVEVQNISLSELYHSMNPKGEESSCTSTKIAKFSSTSFPDLPLDLESNAVGEFDSEKVDPSSSLLDLYINSKFGGYFSDNDAAVKDNSLRTFDSGFRNPDQMNMFKNGKQKAPEVNEFSSGNSIFEDCVVKVSDFLSDSASIGICRSITKENSDLSPCNACQTSPKYLQQTLFPDEQVVLNHSSETIGEDQTDIPQIDLSVAQSHSFDFHVFESSLADKASCNASSFIKGKWHCFGNQDSEVAIKTKQSLFAKVLKCKSKPLKGCALPKPPQTLPEILESIGFNKYFQFTTPSPDDEVKTKQKGAFSSPGSSNTIKAPNLETVEDEKEFIFNREVSGRMMVSNGEIKTDDFERSDVENGAKEKSAVPEEETDSVKAAEKRDILPTAFEEEKSTKNEESSATQPVELISKLKNVANDKEVLEAYKKERGGNKPLINLVVIGHVDAGKSTLMGHLLYRLGCVAKKMMHKYEQDSKKLGKSSFMYAWVLDETSEERNRGITMDVAQSRFETPHRSVTLLDAPGHKDFIPNMITGAAQADVAVLVLDSTRGEFETGFEAGGQTREHTMLIRSLGVSQLAVAVNKLDNVNWDQGRYNEIVTKLSAFLKQAGFKEAEVQFVPCSGLTGENLIKPPETPELKKWYSGPCLVDVIDGFKPPERPVSKPFRFCISDVFKGMGSGFCVSGRIEAGYVQNGDKVLVMPAAEQVTVKGITIDETSVQHSFAGDHVTLQLSGVDMNSVTTGCVVCEINRPVKVSARFQARLVIFNITVPITKGFPVILHYQSMSEQAFVKKLISQLHRSTGQVVKKKPRCLTKNTSAVVEIEVLKPICLEVYKDFKELGRFMLRSGGSTIAAGLVTEIL